VFENSLEKQPFDVRVGAGQVIPGLDEGLLSMKVSTAHLVAAAVWLWSDHAHPILVPKIECKLLCGKGVPEERGAHFPDLYASSEGLLLTRSWVFLQRASRSSAAGDPTRAAARRGLSCCCLCAGINRWILLGYDSIVSCICRQELRWICACVCL
jgi:hypothetical protein